MSPDRSIWPWSELALPGPAPLRDIKRAYAARLKVIDRSDPAAFQALQQVFDAAKARALADGGGAKPAARPAVAELILSAPRAEAEEKAPVRDERPTEMLARLDLAIDGNWDLERIEALLSDPVAEDAPTREALETRLFTQFADGLTWDRPRTERSRALLLDRHFGWGSDVARFRQRFGRDDRARLVAHVIAEIIAHPEPSAPARIDTRDNRATWPLRLAFLGIGAGLGAWGLGDGTGLAQGLMLVAGSLGLLDVFHAGEDIKGRTRSPRQRLIDTGLAGLVPCLLLGAILR